MPRRGYRFCPMRSAHEDCISTRKTRRRPTRVAPARTWSSMTWSAPCRTRFSVAIQETDTEIRYLTSIPARSLRASPGVGKSRSDAERYLGIEGTEMTSEQITGIIRAILAALGGFVLAKGWVSSETWAWIVGGAATIGPAIWSWVSNRPR